MPRGGRGDRGRGASESNARGRGGRGGARGRDARPISATPSNQAKQLPAGKKPRGRGRGGFLPGSRIQEMTPIGAFGATVRVTPAATVVDVKLASKQIDESSAPLLNEWMDSDFVPFIRKLHDQIRGVSAPAVNNRTASGFIDPKQRQPLTLPPIRVSFEFQDNEIGVQFLSRFLDKLVQVLSVPPIPMFHVTSLKMWNNQIGDDAADCIADFIAFVMSSRANLQPAILTTARNSMFSLSGTRLPLLELHLSHNQLTASGAAKLLRALSDAYTTPAAPGQALGKRISPMFPLWLRSFFFLCPAANLSLLIHVFFSSL